MTKPGILALWQDCVAGQEPVLERWYQSEHLAERLGVPGFLRGRRYEAVEARQSYFTYYETETPEVLISPAYRARLDSPTPLTRQVMSEVFLRMSRTICRVERRAGEIRGAWAVTAKLSDPAIMDGSDLPDTLAAAPGVARTELWAAADDIAPPPSDEEKLRGGDDRIVACLFVETLRDADARAAAQTITERLASAVDEIGLYRLLCELAR
jgi:hypothetical protein